MSGAYWDVTTCSWRADRSGQYWDLHTCSWQDVAHDVPPAAVQHEASAGVPAQLTAADAEQAESLTRTS